jgi:hypothetical protein
MDPALIFPLGIAAFIILIFTGYAYGKRRIEAFHRFARRKGMSFTKKADPAAVNQFNDLELIPDNTINTVSNIIQGDVDGISVMICDVRITKLTGNTSMPTHQNGHTVAILQGDQINLPFFTMHPANFIYKMLRTLGKQSIVFPSHPEFADTYVLKGDDENALRKSFHDQAVSYFMHHKELSIEGRGNRLLYFRFGEFIKPGELHSFLSDSISVFRLFK